MRRLVLASSSPFRRELLSRLQLAFEVVSPEIDEAQLKNESPSDLIKRLSIEKAKAVAALLPDSIVIGGDQIAVCEQKILGKPGNLETAISQLEWVSNKRVVFQTGLCVFDSATNALQYDEVPFSVQFRPLSSSDIRNYLRKEPAFNCAGSFKSEGLGIALTSSMHGEDMTALIGLPLIRLTRMLKNVGIDVLA